MSPAARRVVTGRGPAGEPIVLFDGEPRTLDFRRARAVELWSTPDSPAPIQSGVDVAESEWRLEPVPRGSAFRLVTYEPGAEIDVHATQTLDYVVVLAGELTLILAGQDVTLRAGDTLVQQATAHGWANRSSEPCTIAVVLLSTRGDG